MKALIVGCCRYEVAAAPCCENCYPLEILICFQSSASRFGKKLRNKSIRRAKFMEKLRNFEEGVLITGKEIKKIQRQRLGISNYKS